MTLLEQIQEQLRALPPEKQSEVLDFATFLKQRIKMSSEPSRRWSLRKHPAYGSWKARKIDSLAYEQSLRAEWAGYSCSV